MSLSTLMSLAPPPVAPTSPGNPGGWAAIEQRLGLSLPSDYKQIINIYGHVEWCGRLILGNPFFSEAEYFQDLGFFSDYVRNDIEEYPDDIPYVPYPEPSGVIYCGRDSFSVDYWWLTTGDPDTWLVGARRNFHYEAYGCTLSDFLVRLLRREAPIFGSVMEFKAPYLVLT